MIVFPASAGVFLICSRSMRRSGEWICNKHQSVILSGMTLAPSVELSKQLENPFGVVDVLAYIAPVASRATLKGFFCGGCGWQRR